MFKTFFSDLFTFPSLSFSFLSVWFRNFLYFRKSIWVSVFWIILEPLVYLVAIGYGVGSYIADIEGMSYIQFFAPALMVISGMFISFFESGYGCFTKLSRQNTYATILLTPISSDELAFGEILWGATKGFVSVVAIAIVCKLRGLIDLQYILPCLGILFLMCWLFSAFGLLLASWAKNYDSFIYVQSGVIIPLSLFSGTYFPLTQLPDFLQDLAYLSPVTHAIEATRVLGAGSIHSGVFLNAAFLLCVAMALTNWATNSLKRKLIR